MKRCPQCNSVFDDSLVFCTNDGMPLVAETFVMPSEVSEPDAEEETVIHHDPVVIDLSTQNPPTAPTEQFQYQPPAETVAPIVVVEKRRNTGKYLLFLMLGLLLGGGLVLAAGLFGFYLYQNRATTVSNAPTPATPANSKQTPKATPTATPVTASAEHEKRTDAEDAEFNGRVISPNAYVRFLPSRNSTEIAVLPVNDRLHIDARENENSPWYHVTCEHGTTGWMHGNTIEYTK